MTWRWTCALLCALGLGACSAPLAQRPTALDPSNPDAPEGAAAPSALRALAEEQYTCPMHPDVVSEQPGNCPRCRMPLTLKPAHAEHRP